jgi:hypothetical protein
MCARIDQIEVGEAPQLIHPVFIKRSVARNTVFSPTSTSRPKLESRIFEGKYPFKTSN